MNDLTPIIVPSVTVNGPVTCAPLTTPASTALSQIVGGALAGATLYVRISLTTSFGETLSSTAVSLAVTANHLLVVAAPAKPNTANVTGWNVYVGATGAEVKQNSLPLSFSTSWTEPTSGLIAGAALPTFNLTAGAMSCGASYADFGSHTLVAGSSTVIPNSTLTLFRNAANNATNAALFDFGTLLLRGALIVQADVSSGAGGFINGGLSEAGIAYNATGNGDLSFYATGTGATVAASFNHWNGTAYAQSSRIAIDGTYTTGSSTYGPTSISLNGTTANKVGGGVWGATSDERTKRNIKPFDVGLSKINALQPIEFEYNGKGGTLDDGQRFVGMSAQKLQKILPSCVYKMQNRLNKDDAKMSDILHVDASDLIYILINAVKELSAQVDTLQGKVKALG